MHGIAADLARALGSEVVALAALGGGDVAQAFRATLDDGRSVFAKTKRDAPDGFFATEAAGLSWLRSAKALAIPEVLHVSDRPPLLVLEWIEIGRARHDTEPAFGRALAQLHRAGAPCFGREDARPTGSRHLPNPPTATWAEFFADCRLRPLARLAHDEGALSRTAVDGLERVADRLAEYGAADEPPSRLHGDLWGGNRLIDAEGSSWLIDPAAHGGHREFDLSMMRLFGGFGEACFRAYEELHPLAPGAEERVALHQLAPLAVHAIKFGGSYAGATQQALDSLL